MTRKNTNKGFILAETLVAVVIDACLMITFFIVFVLFWNVFLAQNHKAQFFREAYTVQAYLKSDIKKADEIIVSPGEIQITIDEQEIVYICDDAIYRNDKLLLSNANQITLEQEIINDKTLVKLILQKQGVNLYINAGFNSSI